jgi:hypothetical protein
MKIAIKPCCSFLLFPLLFTISSFNKKPFIVSLKVSTNESPVLYAVSKLKALQNSKTILFSNQNPNIIINAKIDSQILQKEAYKIIANKNVVEVIGGNAVGLMYGLLDIRNQIKLGRSVIENKQEDPDLSFRAIKFNLPWDSYRRSPALDVHKETCRDTIFWQSFLDMMVENKFNKLTLWNLHPFSYMVKTEKYPEGCSLNDTELAEWQKFWKSLFRMAKNVGIETYLVNWNIFVSPQFAKAHNVCNYCIEGKHFVPQGDTSSITKDFYKESIKAVIDTYTDLTGLGITLGEGMGNMTAPERQNWILENYVQGIRMASRKVKFIYRVPLSAGSGSGGTTSVETEKLTRNVLDTLTCFEGPINIELKFNWSHAYSTPSLVKVHGGKLNDVYWNPNPANYSLSWMMRNEDFFMLRWGQQDFFRKHISQNVKPFVSGYYVGSETYIPAKDYFTSLSGSSYKYAFQRQWMYYKVMGNLMYNNNTSDDFFEMEFKQRFPNSGKQLFEAQKEVSKVPLIIASWQNATWDFSLYSEGFLYSTKIQDKKVQKLIPLTDLAEKIPMEPRYLSINDFLANEANLVNNKISPIKLADSLEIFCNNALLKINSVLPKNNTDLQYELADIKAWAYLGLYFSHKLKAAVEYKRFKKLNNKTNLQLAINYLTKATNNWHSLVNVTKAVYKPVPLTHFCENDANFPEVFFHWSIVQKQVDEELSEFKKLY